MPNLIGRSRSPSSADSGWKTRGQALAELALVLPVLLLMLLFVVDFGRIYLGYVNMQQMARVGAGFAAEHASAWASPQDAATLARYQNMMENDASAINCDLVRNDNGNLYDPEFVDGGFSLGQRVEVRVKCEFGIITPIISSVLGETVDLTADVVYPIREGVVAEVPGGGGVTLSPPVADFVGSPQSGYGTPESPLEVSFFDRSTSAATWDWNFGNGTATGVGPHVVRYSCLASVLPGESCTFTVSLRAGGLGGSDTETKTGYITVDVPPESGPIAEFVAAPRFGSSPLTVDFDFVDVRAGDVVYTNYQWDVDYDGSTPSYEFEGPDQASVTWKYQNEGVYAVRLVVTDESSGIDQLTKLAYVVITPPVCTVPDFGNKKLSAAQTLWSQAGFTTQVLSLPGKNDYKINYQSLLGGVIDPQPDGCDSTITVGP